MDWLVLLKAFLALANLAAKYVTDEQLLKAGEGRAVLKQLEELNARVRKADEARNASLNDSAAGGLRNDDGYKRD
jgi:hypothetical protein